MSHTGGDGSIKLQMGEAGVTSAAAAATGTGTGMESGTSSSAGPFQAARLLPEIHIDTSRLDGLLSSFQRRLTALETSFANVAESAAEAVHKVWRLTVRGSYGAVVADAQERSTGTMYICIHMRWTTARMKWGTYICTQSLFA